MKPSLFAHPFASYCQKVLIALYENGVDFTYRKIGPDDPSAMSELVIPVPRSLFHAIRKKRWRSECRTAFSTTM